MEKTSKPLKMAVVGCGWFTQVAHLPALRLLEDAGLVEVTALLSRRQDSVARANKTLGREVQAYSDYGALLANPDIQAVDIVLPTPLMASAVRSALASGKYVISEKPCAPAVDQCADLLKTYSQCQGKVAWAVAENWRFKPIVQWLVETITSGRLGGLKRVDFEYNSLGWANDQGWRSSPNFRGGYLLDSGVHFVAMLRLLTDGFLEVNASVGWRSVSHVADHVIAQCKYVKGAGTFRVSFREQRPDESAYQLSIQAELGELRADFLKSRVELKLGGEVEYKEFPNDPWVQGGVYPMLRHCIESFSLGQAPSCSPMEAMRDVAVIEAMLESSRLAQPVRPALLHAQLNGSGPARTTFARFQDFSPEQVVDCCNKEDVGIALREAASRGLKVRLMGAGNSWSPYLKTTGASIRLTGLKQISNVDPLSKTVWVGAGTRLGDLTKALALRGLCLPSLPFFTDATVGGAVATGMHGTSPSWGTVSDLVVSSRLITASGEELLINNQSQEGLLKASRVSVGMLGVLVELELQAIDMVWARNVRLDVTFPDFLNIRKALFEQFRHIWVHWILGQEKMVIQCLELSHEPKDGYTPYVSGDKACWIPAYQGPAPRLASEGLMLSMQYALELDSLEEAVKKVNESAFARENTGKEIEIKFLQKSSASFLGPNADMDVACLNTWWPVEKTRANLVFQSLEKIMQEFGARPHWGKQHQPPTHDYLRRCYPHWQTFEAVRTKLDPDGMFSIF